MRIQKHLQRFADRHGLQVERYAIRGPRGEIFEACGGLYYFQPGTGNHVFHRTAGAKQAIEAIGLQYTAPVEPVKAPRRALLIARKAKKEMTIGEFAWTYGFKARKYFPCINKSRRHAKGGIWGYILEGENGQMRCSMTRSGIGDFEFDPRNPIEAAAAIDAIGLDHWRIWRRCGRNVDGGDPEAVAASQHEWSLAVESCRRGKSRQEGTPQSSEAAYGTKTQRNMSERVNWNCTVNRLAGEYGSEIGHSQPARGRDLPLLGVL